MLGKKVRDKFSGLQGVATAVITFASGEPDSYGVETLHEGRITTTWISVGRLEIVE